MDLTSYWALYQQHKAKSSQVLLLIIALLVGWQLGRITSPYYAAHPIVFQENSSGQASGGTPEELKALKQEGIASKKGSDEAMAKVDAPASSATPVSAVAGTSTDKAVSGKFVASVNSDLFHDPSCSSSKRIKESNQVWFSSIEEAKQAGYSPGKCTQDLLGL